MYDKDKKDRERVDNVLKTFENTLSGIFSSVEKTNNKFYDMATRIEIAHFKQLEKQYDKQNRAFDKNVDKLLELLKEKKVSEQQVERISTLDKDVPNSIEKEEEIENPLEDISPAQFKNMKGFQIDGQEEIYPVSIE